MGLMQASSNDAHNPHPLSPPRLPLPALNFHRAWWFADACNERGSAPTKQMLLGQVKSLLQRSLDKKSGISILSRSYSQTVA